MDYYFKEYQRSCILTNHLNMGGANPDGDRIDVNSLYFIRNNLPWIGVMGEFHYSRCPREYWYDELCKMKAGGITIVASYIFWIYHEEIEGVFDFQGDNDLRTFVTEAARAGLDVVIRIGPWAHGECRNGGFPDWLIKKSYELRRNNEDYLKQVGHFYKKIAEQTEGLFFKDGGNIIGVQIENELTDGAEHLKTLKELAVRCGMTAPLYTVTGWNSASGARIPVDEVVPVFGGYCEAPWEQHTEKLLPSTNYFFNRMRNDSAIGSDLLAMEVTSDDGWQLPYERYPFATCEIGGGIQVTYHRRPCISGMDVYALALVKLGSGNNLPGYYMYHGGVNQIGKSSTFQESKESGYPNDLPILSYDFQAPLSEYGEVREQYRLLNLINLFAQDFGRMLAPMIAVDAKQPVSNRYDTESLRFEMRTDGNAGFVFVNHYQRLEQLDDIKDAVIHTGKVTFPAIDICGEISFFFPFRMDMAGDMLEYATAQPVCKEGNTFFFVAIPGIRPEYKFDNGEIYIVANESNCVITVGDINIVTLKWEQGRYLRKLEKKVYLGQECDLYFADGRVWSVEDGEFDYGVWDGIKFKKEHLSQPCMELKVQFENVAEPPFNPSYRKEILLGGEKKVSWKKIRVSGTQGFVSIEEPYDAAQIYADGKLIADSFYYGKPWRVPASILHGKEVYLVMSELGDNFYQEF